jgi:hypothetical protein
MSYWNVLSRAGRYAEALQSMDTNRVWFAGDRAFSLLEVGLATHSGMTDRAGALLASMGDALEVRLARSEHLLQSGRPDEAARILEAVTVVQPTNLTAWALLEPCWRLLNDARHEWLIGEGRLYGVTALDLDPSDLGRIAAKLRELHRAQAQPLGQSIRGGTQTSGDLFGRRGPEVSQLQQAVISAAQRFIGTLPPADPTHPLLRYRDHSLAFGPSWSVRLAERGFHAPHFHPGGILSSACYISLPAGLSDRQERQGWLEIGRPPGELKTDLPPLASFEPKAGDLVLFPSFLFHGTRPFAAGERLTVAFDIVA